MTAVWADTIARPAFWLFSFKAMKAYWLPAEGIFLLTCQVILSKMFMIQYVS